MALWSPARGSQPGCGGGEFAYRDGPWKLVFKMSGKNLQQSRGKPTIAELYNLDSDVSEQNNLSNKHPKNSSAYD